MAPNSIYVVSSEFLPKLLKGKIWRETEADRQGSIYYLPGRVSNPLNWLDST